MKYFNYLILLVSFSLIISCNNCEEIAAIPCGEDGTGMSGGGEIIVDLIVLVDYSSSMGSAHDAISIASEQAIKNSSDSCNTDLKVTYLGVEDSGNAFGSQSVFQISHRDYLDSITMGNVSNGTIPLAVDRPPSSYITEKGANCIEDLSQHFDWRQDACRAIFYISDEELDGSSPRMDYAQEQSEVDLAIVAANNNEVSVFSHLIDQETDQTIATHSTVIWDMYEQLSNETDGLNVRKSSVSADFYESLMAQIICNSCGVSVVNDPCSLNEFIR